MSDALQAVLQSSDATQPSTPDSDQNSLNVAQPTDLNQTSETASTEPAAPEQAETKKEETAKIDESFAKKFAALSRKEKQLKHQERQMQLKIQEMEQRIKAQEDSLSPYRKLKESLDSKQNPLDALSALGLDYKKLTDEFILRPEPTEQDKVQSYVKSLEEKLAAIENKLSKQDEESKKAQEEAKKAQQERAKQNYLSHLNEYVEKNAEKYELIKANDAADLIYEVMEAHYNRTEQETGEPEILSEEQAADMVEAHLLEEAKKIAQANKIKGLLGVQAKPQQEPQKTPTGKSQTLSNNMSQQVPTKTEKYMSDEESKRYIASMLKFNS